MRKIQGQYPEFPRSGMGQYNCYRVSAYDLAYVRCNRTQQVPRLKIRCDSICQVQKQLQLIILMLCAPEIQTIIKCEGDDTPDQPQETYFFLAEWIHCVAVDSENTQSTMRRRQGYPKSRPEAYFLGPFFKLRVPLFRVPIGSMLWIPAAHGLPPWQLFHRQVR